MSDSDAPIKVKWKGILEGGIIFENRSIFLRNSALMKLTMAALQNKKDKANMPSCKLPGPS